MEFLYETRLYICSIYNEKDIFQSSLKYAKRQVQFSATNLYNLHQRMFIRVFQSVTYVQLEMSTNHFSTSVTGLKRK